MNTSALACRPNTLALLSWHDYFAMLLIIDYSDLDDNAFNTVTTRLTKTPKALIDFLESQQIATEQQ